MRHDNRPHPQPKLLDESVLGGFALRRYAFAPRFHVGRHAHERPTLIAMLRGGYTGAMPRADYEAAHGELVVVPSGVPHADTVCREGAAAVFIEPPADRLEYVHDGFFDTLRRFRSASLAALQQRLGREMHGLDAMSALAAESAVHELIAMAARLAEVREHPRAAWLLTLRDRLDDDLEAPPSMDDLVRDAGVSRAHVARTFRRAFGRSIGEYVRQRRVDRAVRLLSETDRPLAEIALACGFYDQSHLCRLIRRHVGATPAEIRNGPTRH